MLQEERIQQLAPNRLYLPIPWQPMVYEQPVTMFKVCAGAPAPTWHCMQKTTQPGAECAGRLHAQHTTFVTESTASFSLHI